MADISPARLEEMLAMWEANMSAENIAKELDLPITRVRKELAAHGRKKKPLAIQANEAQIVQAYSEWVSVAEILAKFSITYPMLYTILNRNGVPIRKVASAAGRQLQLETAVALYKEGVPLWRIHQETGIAQPTLHARLHELGIPLRRPRS